MKERRLIVALLSAALAVLPAVAQKRVVASTAWTAAIARAGGAEDIAVVAPVDLKHPPEYEVKPSDLASVAGADLVVAAGYEKFAKRLAEVAGSGKVPVLEVYTDNLPPVFKREALKVAEALGTRTRYDAWEKGFDERTAAMREKIMAAYPDRRAAVHRFLKTYAEWLGFEVVGTFGPGEPSPAVVLDLVRAKPAVVIDNWHNVAGLPVAESLGCSYVELINFPGKAGTATIDDVFSYNERRFLEAAPKR